ncbi:GNAT family N-acetyltransferase [Microbacterium sp. 22242]|uniref:GNAT family N-acetyltransferase n=1 Tax=Microbacterium sp. 22242 TaxID=3453896 RepID=UPI003F833A57
MASSPEMSSLRTARLLLRRQQAGDAAVFRRLWTERDERVPPHRRIDAEDRPTEQDIAAHILEAGSSTGPALLTVQRIDNGEVIGYCGLIVGGNGTADEPELGFELLQVVHNRGYATEAARAVLDWAAENGYPRVWAGVWEWNVASRRVLEKLGFIDSGRELPASVHGRNLLTVCVLAPPSSAPST